MLSQSKSRIVTNVVRTLSTTSRSTSNHYDALGIAPSATQGDIKSAYYKLSKIYHPDKSNTDESAKKFRAITEAYEVLGNVKLKKMYDKGLLTGRENITRMEYHPDPEPLDPTLKFYKSRAVRHMTPTVDGRPVYDFESWSKQHYGEVFQERQYERNFIKTKRKVEDAKTHAKQEQMGVTFILALFMLVLFVVVYGEDSYDVDRTKQEQRNSAK